MAIKALNDTTGPNRLILILLVFDMYPYINQDSPPFLEIIQQAKAVQKAMKIFREICTEVDINRMLNTRNRPRIHDILNLSIGSEVMV